MVQAEKLEGRRISGAGKVGPSLSLEEEEFAVSEKMNGMKGVNFEWRMEWRKVAMFARAWGLRAAIYIGQMTTEITSNVMLACAWSNSVSRGMSSSSTKS